MNPQGPIDPTMAMMMQFMTNPQMMAAFAAVAAQQQAPSANAGTAPGPSSSNPSHNPPAPSYTPMSILDVLAGTTSGTAQPGRDASTGTITDPVNLQYAGGKKRKKKKDWRPNCPASSAVAANAKDFEESSDEEGDGTEGVGGSKGGGGSTGKKSRVGGGGGGRGARSGNSGAGGKSGPTGAQVKAGERQRLLLAPSSLFNSSWAENVGRTKVDVLYRTALELDRAVAPGYTSRMSALDVAVETADVAEGYGLDLRPYSWMSFLPELRSFKKQRDGGSDKGPNGTHLGSIFNEQPFGLLNLHPHPSQVAGSVGSATADDWFTTKVKTQSRLLLDRRRHDQRIRTHDPTLPLDDKKEFRCGRCGHHVPLRFEEVHMEPGRCRNLEDLRAEREEREMGRGKGKGKAKAKGRGKMAEMSDSDRSLIDDPPSPFGLGEATESALRSGRESAPEPGQGWEMPKADDHLWEDARASAQYEPPVSSAAGPSQQRGQLPSAAPPLPAGPSRHHRQPASEPPLFPSPFPFPFPFSWPAAPAPPSANPGIRSPFPALGSSFPFSGYGLPTPSWPAHDAASATPHARISSLQPSPLPVSRSLTHTTSAASMQEESLRSIDEIAPEPTPRIVPPHSFRPGPGISAGEVQGTTIVAPFVRPPGLVPSRLPPPPSMSGSGRKYAGASQAPLLHAGVGYGRGGGNDHQGDVRSAEPGPGEQDVGAMGLDLRGETGSRLALGLVGDLGPNAPRQYNTFPSNSATPHPALRPMPGATGDSSLGISTLPNPPHSTAMPSPGHEGGRRGSLLDEELDPVSVPGEGAERTDCPEQGGAHGGVVEATGTSAGAYTDTTSGNNSRAASTIPVPDPTHPTPLAPTPPSFDPPPRKPARRPRQPRSAIADPDPPVRVTRSSASHAPQQPSPSAPRSTRSRRKGESSKGE